ncbi:MAG: hypothetical protein FJX02_03410 [Alphaproteobacteria bacterium]|nr:hypothetical protein [Alphaproteobacteria bacterium]
MIGRVVLPFLLCAALAAPAAAQPRPAQQREDLLDAITRHISLCTEFSDDRERLACFDRLQTRIGSAGPAAAPQPSPLARPGTSPPAGTRPGDVQPLGVPGGGAATLGGTGPATSDPDRAFDPRQSTYRPPEQLAAKPQPAVRRTGPRPIPPARGPQSLIALDANNLTYGEARYWQVTITIVSQTQRTLDVQIQCTFTNSGKPVEDVYFGPVPIQPGEQISTELIGPPTTAFIDTANCRVLSP